MSRMEQFAEKAVAACKAEGPMLATMIAHKRAAPGEKSAQQIHDLVMAYGSVETCNLWADKLLEAMDQTPRSRTVEKRVPAEEGSKTKTQKKTETEIAGDMWWAPIQDWLDAVDERIKLLSGGNADAEVVELKGKREAS